MNRKSHKKQLTSAFKNEVDTAINIFMNQFLNVHDFLFFRFPLSFLTMKLSS